MSLDMTDKITYSFVIPHKNSPTLLRRCLDSIPQRNDVEVIVVDNNSSDDIVDIKKLPGHEREDVSIIRDNESIGGGGARNTGLAKTKGKWVLFADADDYYLDGFLNGLDAFSSSNNDVVYFNFRNLQNGKETELPFLLRGLKDAYSNQKDNQELLRYKFSAPWNKMISREFLEHYHITFEDCEVGNDILFNCQVGYHAQKIEIINKKLYNYIIHEGSVTTSKMKNIAFYLCRFRHHYQQNAFYDFVNHPEWKRNIMVIILSFLKKYGISQTIYALFILVFNFGNIKREKNLIVDKVLGKL